MKSSNFFFIAVIYSNIGLIKLQAPVDFDTYLKPVHIACSSPDNLDLIAIANNILVSPIKKVLQYIHMKMTSMDNCAKYLPSAAFRKSKFCAAGNGAQGICQADSGAPLIDAKSGHLIAITQSAPALSVCERPRPFTRVSEYVPWIQAITGVPCKKQALQIIEQTTPKTKAPRKHKKPRKQKRPRTKKSRRVGNYTVPMSTILLLFS